MSSFIYETPEWMVAAAVCGIALFIFSSVLSTTFLSLAGSALLTRLIAKAIKTVYPEQTKALKRRLYAFDAEHSHLVYLALLVSLLAAPYSMIGAASIAMAGGVYKGLLIEREILRYKKHIRRIELTTPFSDHISKINRL